MIINNENNNKRKGDELISNKVKKSRFNSSSKNSLPTNNSINNNLPEKIDNIIPEVNSNDDVDPLDAFMSGLYQSGQIESQKQLNVNKPTTKPKQITSESDYDEYDFYTGQTSVNPFGSNFITLEEIMKDSKGNDYLGWESDATTTNITNDNSNITISNGNTTKSHQIDDNDNDDDDNANDEDKDDREHQEFINAILKSREQEDNQINEINSNILKHNHIAINSSNDDNISNYIPNYPNKSSKKNKSSDLGIIFAEDGDVGDNADESDIKKKSALEILEESKRNKELKQIDHSQVNYLPFRKNIYYVPKSLSSLTDKQIKDKRESLAIVVRGKGCPVPVDSWEHCGLSEKIIQILHNHNLNEPFAIQKQAIPAIMCGRDIIGVAKTGSGKTLAFLLPMIRHIQDQPPLVYGDGPIGLIMAPARELALQIGHEAKKITKHLGLKVACVYGGAGVAEQIGDLKRGAEIVVCTPGRMIELLSMQAGRMISLRRVTMVVLDEADRMFDLGFEPQIKMIIQNIRPDKQILLFSATFPKPIEKIARTILKFPLEIIIGERSTVNKDITQIVEVHEEEDKYLRLLQLLGIYYEHGSILVFVDKQEKCDSIYSDLLKSGYPCCSLHGGKEQIDRDETIYQFKQGIFKVMIATSVAGRGLDVPDIICVVNYNCPNHLEDYVHRVGRTGRAGRKGIAYTFISEKEEQFSPILIKALEKANIDPPIELTKLYEEFKNKVNQGLAHHVGSGFVGKGYKFDESEMNESQKLQSLQRKQYDIENGLIDDDDGNIGDEEDTYEEYNENISQTTTTTINNTSSSKSIITSEKKPSVTVTSNPTSTPVDINAAVAKAAMLAKKFATAPNGQAPAEFADEVEINDYPNEVRRKVGQKKVVTDIQEHTDTTIKQRGTHIPPGKKPEFGEKKLYLHITGKSEIAVKQAKAEILRLLEEETTKLGALGAGLSSLGRYALM